MQSLNKITEQLYSLQEEDRRQAVEHLKQLDTYEALELANHALGDVSWRVRKNAVEVYRWFPDREAAIANLVAALHDAENAGRRGSAVEALVGMGKRAVPNLLQSLPGGDADVRKFIIDILGEIKDVTAVKEMKKLLSDPEENVRLATVEALGNIGDDEAYGILLDLLSKKDLTLTFSALHSLSKLGRQVPISTIRSLLGVKILKRAAYDLLGNDPTPEAVEILSYGLVDASKSTRQAAIRAMALLLGQSEKNGLGLSIESAVRKAWTGRKLEIIEDFLDSPQIHTKRSIVELLGLLGTQDAVRQLLKVVVDENLHSELCKALERCRTHQPFIFDDLIKQQDPQVQQKVRELLQDIRPVSFKTGLAPKIEMSEEQFQWLRDAVSDYCGLFFDDELKFLVERRALRRMEALGIRNFADYLDLLKMPGKGPQEMDQIVTVLSTNETYFFREEFQLRAFRDEILGEMIEHKRKLGDKRLRIWSAGCSSGEEPYTIAILLLERGGLDDFKIEIMGSDISSEVIDKARGAAYPLSSFRVTDEFYIKRYFTKDKGNYLLQDRVREMVKFSQINLMKAADMPDLANLDLIFCRNVIIYFSLEAKKQVVTNFHQLLRPAGFLLLGHSESLMNISNDFKLRHFKNDMVYQRPLGPGGRGHA